MLSSLQMKKELSLVISFYVRETIHAVKDVEKIANGTENTNYEVTMRHCHYSYL